ncbi:DNA-binding protein [Luteibacter aegosomatissinici]|uniref:DNA-binding protein n=1 Tax=Luteibacter aegosomatissinici TaxID=2911539 RepID=UPI001FFB6892|nr:DNA-binding protein [Luteibacter aegosomatissinici]UPG96555.1 DNA-binding protein [Luteibacter aegosomatissinici]
MARGITENDVHGAADALVEAGERPTVERIRAHLGSGSPNTVTRHLDSWWGRLGSRLRQQRQAAALPAAPFAIGDLAAQLWDAALRSAREEAHAALATDRETLAAEREALVEADAARQATVREVLTAAEHAAHAQRSAEQRLRDLQQWCDQQQTQLNDLRAQRDAAEERVHRADQEAMAQAARSRTRDAEDAAERQRLAEHVRAVEDRAHAEVDRIRAELRAVQKQRDATQGEQRTRDEAARRREAALRQAVIDAQREAAVAAARADAVLTTQQALVRQVRTRAKAAATVPAQRPATPRRRATPGQAKPAAKKKVRAKRGA